LRIFEREGYILAVATGFLYLRAYFSILAAAKFYEIPIQFMSVDLLQLTQSAIGGMASLSGMAAMPLVIYVWLAFGAKKPKIIYFLIVSFLMAAVTYFSLRNDGDTSAFVMALVAFALTMTAYVFLWYFSRDRSFANHLVQNIDGEMKNLFSIGKFRVALFVFVFIFSLATAYFAVYVGSYSLNKYNVFYKNGCYAIINSSQDNIVAKKVVNGKLMDGYYIFKVEALNDIEVKKMDIRTLSSSERESFEGGSNLNVLPSSRI